MSIISKTLTQGNNFYVFLPGPGCEVILHTFWHDDIESMTPPSIMDHAWLPMVGSERRQILVLDIMMKII